MQPRSSLAAAAEKTSPLAAKSGSVKMNVIAVLNRDGGTLKTTDLAALQEHIVQRFRDVGHQVDCEATDAKGLRRALTAAARSSYHDVLLVGGGDGTVSAAASVAWKHGKCLAVLPAGTMNLFARSLGIPMDMDEAVAALAQGHKTMVDIATANGHPFVHQLSIGFQARTILLREKLQFASRYGKMMAGIRAMANVATNPPRFQVRLAIDNSDAAPHVVSAVAVTNNVFGEGHMPYADTLNEGRLGIYNIAPITTRHAARLIFDVMRGGIYENEHVAVQTGKHVRLEFSHKRNTKKALIDGELIDLPPMIDVQIHPQDLNVLMPRALPAGGVR